MQGGLSLLNPAVVSFFQGLTLHIHMAAGVLLEPPVRVACPSPSLALTLTHTFSGMWYIWVLKRHFPRVEVWRPWRNPKPRV